MGEAKKKLSATKRLLEAHPNCCYCGKLATTTDHFPPRALFLWKAWPEGYEFPACKPCNEQGRQDEQAVGVIGRLWATKTPTHAEQLYWEKLAKGLRNNQPALFNELIPNYSRNEHRREFRRLFGELGDRLRKQGYGLATLGPLSNAALERFGLKLGKALFYKHTGSIIDGDIWVNRFAAWGDQTDRATLETMLNIAPLKSKTVRSGKNLSNQFTYFYNTRPGPEPVLYAMVQFTDQLLYQIICVSDTFRQTIGGHMGYLDEQPMVSLKVNARLN